MNKKLLACLLTGTMTTAMLAGCGSKAPEATEDASETYKVGIVNYVDDASLNQIVENIESELDAKGKELGVKFEYEPYYANAQADASVLNQIAADEIADDVDVIVAIATPVAMTMQAATEDTDIPVVFSAVSDPVSAGLVESMEEPGGNLTGTSDYLDTEKLLNLIIAQNPEMKKLGLLYDTAQDSSTGPIEDAKKWCEEKGVEVVEKTGGNTDDVSLAADALIEAQVDAIFTPTDNTIMTAELSIYEKIAEAGIPHYCGADSFALNGAFCGYGVDYAELGKTTGDMIVELLVNDGDPATTPVETFDNGTATINTEICEQLGLDIDEITKIFEPLCMEIKTLTTAENF